MFSNISIYIRLWWWNCKREKSPTSECTHIWALLHMCLECSVNVLSYILPSYQLYVCTPPRDHWKQIKQFIVTYLLIMNLIHFYYLWFINWANEVLIIYDFLCWTCLRFGEHIKCVSCAECNAAFRILAYKSIRWYVADAGETVRIWRRFILHQSRLFLILVFFSVKPSSSHCSRPLWLHNQFEEYNKELKLEFLNIRLHYLRIVS